MGCGLRREIEDMLSLVPGEWELKLTKRRYTMSLNTKYEIRKPGYFGYPAVSGYGGSKKAALDDLLYNWRRGWSGVGPAGVECPARSRAELELKLAVLGKKGF